MTGTSTDQHWLSSNSRDRGEYKHIETHFEQIHSQESGWSEDIIEDIYPVGLNMAP